MKIQATEMIQKLQAARSCAAISTLCLLAMPAYAQQAEETQENLDDFLIEEIIVTATRREESLLDVPVSMTAVDLEKATGEGISDINSLADFVPNLTANDGGSPSLGNLTIRGIYAGGASTTGIYVDDVPYGPVFGGAGDQLALDATLLNLQQLEVVRGPQGTLFGASSMGGVVRYITRKPSLTDIEGYVSADFSDTDRGGVNSRYRASVSIPVIEDKLAISLSGFSEDAEGYVDLPGLGEQDANDHDYDGAQLTVLFQPSEAMEVRYNAVVLDADYGDPGYVLFDVNNGDRPLGEYVGDSSLPTSRAYDYDMHALTINYDFDGATLTSVTSHQTVELANGTDITSSFGGTADFFTGAPFGTHTVLFESTFETDRFTQELRLTSESSDKLEWLVGLYYTSQETDAIQNTIEDPADIVLVRSNVPLEFEEFAAFGNVTLYLSQSWDVTLGLRYSEAESDIEDLSNNNPAFGLPGLAADNSEDVTNYLLNSRYRLSEQTQVYARAASGYRPGGPNLVSQVPVDTDGDGLPDTLMPLGDATYDADELWSYELGIKGTLMDGRIAYDAGVYWIDWGDTQLSTTAGGLGSTINAADDIEATGFEAAIHGKLIEGLELSATLAYADTELQGEEPALGAKAGERLPNNAMVSVSVGADYSFSLMGYDAFVGGSWRYRGPFTSTYQGNGVDLIPVVQNYKNDAYDVLDLRAGITIEQFALNLYMTNVTDESDFQTVFPLAANFSYGVPLRPRTIGANLTYNF